VPEGDTLHRIADRLRPALAGKRLARFEAPRLRGDRPRPGDTIEAVHARGKHLLIDFAGGLTLRTHLRMNGMWHLYRTGERWQRGPQYARAVVETDDGWCAVCFAAPTVETFHRQAAMPAALARLGPDLCEPEVDLGAVLYRFAALTRPEDEIGDVLMDQRIAAGIGNMHKSEACFACGIDPFTPVGRLPDEARRRLYAAAHRNLRSRRGNAVYGRAGRPCPRCGTPIKRRRQGPQARGTYWCPRCQAAPVE
jgi:endonuclease-8